MKDKKGSTAKTNGPPKGPPGTNKVMAEERAEIISWLKAVKFRHKLFGGVDERSVWRKISELDALYTKALEAERKRGDALLAEYRRIAAQAQALQQQPEGGDPSG